MSAIPNLYNDVVLDHIKNARNYRVIETPDRSAEGVNALCGDALSVYVRLDGDVIRDVSFQCSCCGISMASGSVMTEAVKGGTIAGARAMYRSFVRLLTATDELPTEVDLGEVAVLATVRAFPARRNCATLAWDTLMAALEGERETKFFQQTALKGKSKEEP
jgi:nitrogen fixation NifU-like protein